MSFVVNVLQTQAVSMQNTAVPLNDRVRQRLKEEKTRRHLSERDLAGLLNWSQSRIAQKFGGRTPITLDELEALCFALSIQPTEAVRDRGVEFCAELAPTELRFLEVLRSLDATTRDGLYALLHIRSGSVEKRGITQTQIGRVKKVR